MQISYTVRSKGIEFKASIKDREEILEKLRKKPYDRVERDVYAAFHGLCRVKPSDIGAFTDAPIFTESLAQSDMTYPGNAVFYWFPNYMLENPLETLARTGKVFFVKAT